MEDRDEQMRRWAERNMGFRAGEWQVYSLVNGNLVPMGASTPRPTTPVKDWTKIETYWSHLARNTAQQPRGGV